MRKNLKNNFKLLKFQNYIAVIKNSINSEMFKDFYIKTDREKKKNITRNGRLSCAFFVSSILIVFKLIKTTHTTVTGTVEDMSKSGWKKIKKPKIGSMIIWEDKEAHKHIGFYIGSNQAISNSSKKRCIVKHHWTFNGKRKVESIFWNKKLG